MKLLLLTTVALMVAPINSVGVHNKHLGRNTKIGAKSPNVYSIDKSQSYVIPSGKVTKSMKPKKSLKGNNPMKTQTETKPMKAQKPKKSLKGNKPVEAKKETKSKKSLKGNKPVEAKKARKPKKSLKGNKPMKTPKVTKPMKAQKSKKSLKGNKPVEAKKSQKGKKLRKLNDISNCLEWKCEQWCALYTPEMDSKYIKYGCIDDGDYCDCE